jgi:protease I
VGQASSLQEDRFTPVVAAPEKRRYQRVLHEVKPGWTITKEWEGYTIEADVAFRDVRPEEYLGIFFNGERAPEYLRYDEDLARITRHCFTANKPVGCVVGPWIKLLIRARASEGRR